MFIILMIFYHDISLYDLYSILSIDVMVIMFCIYSVETAFRIQCLT